MQKHLDDATFVCNASYSEDRFKNTDLTRKHRNHIKMHNTQKKSESHSDKYMQEAA